MAVLKGLKKYQDQEIGLMRFCESESEMDVRSTYCAAAVYFMITTSLNEAERKIVADDPDEYSFDQKKMIRGLREECEGLSGGFTTTPNYESHSGLTYCALAALKLLGQKLTPLRYL